MSGLEQRLLADLHPSEPVYAVVDGARGPHVRAWAVHGEAPAWCLYREPLPEKLLALAPYLRRLGRGHAATSRFFIEGLGDAWGVLLASAAPSKALRVHLRRFFKVRTEEGATLLFRWYDPRVLRVFLPTLTPAELARFFGPITAFAAEGQEEGSYHLFRRTAQGLDHRLVGPGPAFETTQLVPRAPAEPAAPPEARGGRALLWTLSQASVEAFGEASRQAFVDRMVDSLGRAFPAVKAKVGLRLTSLVERGIAEATRHGLSTEHAIGDYLRLWFAAGFEVEQRWPGSGQVLADERLNERAKVALLRQLAS